MTKVLVVYASRHNATRGIAERIGEVLRANGLKAEVSQADQVVGVGGADAVVVGSAVYMGSWLKEAVEYVERNQLRLARLPLWLFSSGPLPRPSKDGSIGDSLEDTLGPEQGPGSGGRKKLTEITSATNPREHRVFLGAFDPNDPPKGTAERLVRLLPPVQKALPAGDFRDWEAIKAWAQGIAAALAAPMITA